MSSPLYVVLFGFFSGGAILTCLPNIGGILKLNKIIERWWIKYWGRSKMQNFNHIGHVVWTLLLPNPLPDTTKLINLADSYVARLCMKSQVLKLQNINILAFGAISSCVLPCDYWRFGGTCCSYFNLKNFRSDIWGTTLYIVGTGTLRKVDQK
jgi:hypothetical protein